MFEDIAELVFSPFGIGLTLAVSASRTQEGKRVLRLLTKQVVRAGYSFAQVGSEWFSRACDEADKIIVEAETERAKNHITLVPLSGSKGPDS